MNGAGEASGSVLLVGSASREPALLPLDRARTDRFPISLERPSPLRGSNFLNPETTTSRLTTNRASLTLDQPLGQGGGEGTVRAEAGTRFLRLDIEVGGYQGRGLAFVNLDSMLRLVVDGRARAPETLQNRGFSLGPGDTEDAIATFVVPAGAKQLELRYGVPGEQVGSTTIPLPSGGLAR